jgi:hypothetical protein
MVLLDIPISSTDRIGVFCCLFVFPNRGFLCITGWTQTKEPPDSDSGMLELQACDNIPSLN